jgi:hypothetical protein
MELTEEERGDCFVKGGAEKVDTKELFSDLIIVYF